MKQLFIIFLSFVCIQMNSQAQKKILYLIPGQGSDYRIFKYFDFDEIDTAHIHYIIPHENESMKQYAHRLSKQIDTNREYSILGVSLGGMLAVEMSEFLNPDKVILISSAKNRNELPGRYKFMKTVPLNRAFTGGFLQAVAPAAQLIVEPDSKNERELCVSMLKNKNELFMKRSVHMIIHWDRFQNNSGIIHIHGDNDHTIPIRNIHKPNYIIQDGSHMMALTRGEEIKKIVLNELLRN
jgi:pimeloyl-ACP methyl ester carboxylesterase